MKRMISLVLCMAFLLICMAGCNAQISDATSETPLAVIPEAETTTAAEIPQETTAEEVTANTTYPPATVPTQGTTYPPATVPSGIASSSDSTAVQPSAPLVGHICGDWYMRDSGYRIQNDTHYMHCGECDRGKWFDHEYGSTPCTSETVACTVCGYEREPGPYGNLRIHHYVNGECTDCHELEIHAGLTFLYDRYSVGDGRFYSISGLGTYDKTHLIIPETYCGIPVKKIYDGAFAGSELESVVIPDTVEIIGSSAFEGAEKLSRVTFGKSVQTLGSRAFSGCTALTEITLPGSLESMNGAHVFYGCTSLRTVVFEEGALSVGSAMFQDCTALTDVKLASTIKTFGSHAFLNCTSLETITIPASFGTKTGDCADAFAGCTSLKTVIFEEGSGYVGTRMFMGCVNLTDVLLPSTLKVVRPGAFANCEKLTVFRYRGTRSEWMGVEIKGKTEYLNGDILCADGTLTKETLEIYFSQE